MSTELKAKLEAKRITRKAIFDDIESLRDNKAKADKEIAALEKQIAASEVTYSIGDRFVGSTGKCILVRTGTEKYGIVSLATGNYYYGECDTPERCDYITPDELLAIYSGDLTRYWDARKQEKC